MFAIKLPTQGYSKTPPSGRSRRIWSQTQSTGLKNVSSKTFKSLIRPTLQSSSKSNRTTIQLSFRVPFSTNFNAHTASRPRMGHMYFFKYAEKNWTLVGDKGAEIFWTRTLFLCLVHEEDLLAILLSISFGGSESVAQLQKFRPF